jgi:putative acetyltransferase
VEKTKTNKLRAAMYTLNAPSRDEYPILLDIWESSVRATHHFLKEGHVEELKKIIQENKVFDSVELTCARGDKNQVLGFIGVAYGNLEMLFVGSDAIGKGIGKMLIQYAISQLKVTKVDVNEQNEQALKFYEHFGFRTVSRSELDGQGNPYPILHMELV